MSESLVRVIETPNPDAYMFRVQETLVPSGTHEFKREKTQNILLLRHNCSPLKKLS